MIPLRDDNPARTTPYVVWALVAVNVIIYLLEFTGGVVPTRMGMTGPLAGWALVPYEFIHGIDIPTNGSTPLQPYWLTLFTAMFMHGGWLHLGGNMLYLMIFGNNIEDALGHVKFLVFYLVCGVAAALAQIFWNPDSMIPTLGASGAIAGVLGAYLVLFPRAKVDTLIVMVLITRVRLPAYILLGFWIVSQFFSHITGSLAARGHETGGVAYLAHIGGFLAGMLLIRLIGAKPPLPPRPDLYEGYRGGGRY